MPVPKLSHLAKIALIRNIDTLEDVGDLPYNFCRQFLIKIENPEQLRIIEENSPQIQGEDAEVWKAIIRRDIPNYRKWPHEPKSEDSKKWYQVYQYLRRREAEDDAAASERLAARMKQLEDERTANKARIVSEVIPIGRRKPALTRSYAGSSKLSTSLTASTRKPFQPAGTSVPRRVPIAESLIAERKAAKEAQSMNKAVPKVLQSNTSKVPLAKPPNKGAPRDPQPNGRTIANLTSADTRHNGQEGAPTTLAPLRKMAVSRRPIKPTRSLTSTGITPTPSPPPISEPSKKPQSSSTLGTTGNRSEVSLPTRTASSPPRIMKRRRAEANPFMPQKRRLKP